MGRLAWLSAVVVCLGVAACGAVDRHAATLPTHPLAAVPSARLALPAIETKDDDDDDSDKRARQPDNENEPFGHPANPVDTNRVKALIQRYYSAAAHANGSAGCALIYSVMAEAVSVAYAATTSIRGATTCAAVLSKLFQQQHMLVGDGAEVRVTAVRVDLNRASVRLRFGAARASRYILVHRERGAWKMAMLFDSQRPVGVE